MNFKKGKVITLMCFTCLIMSTGSAFSDDDNYNNEKGRIKSLKSISDKDFYDNGKPSNEKIELGKFLFFDKILSGNQNMSCATCHHPLTDTGDGLSLPVGEGAKGLGVTRNTGTGSDAIHERVPRNSPHLFNLGAKEFQVIFHDGRVQLGENDEILTPAGSDLPDNIDNVLAAQAMFPVTSPTEMAGQYGENTIANAAADGNLAGNGGVWEQLAERLKSVPGYVDMFINTFDDITIANDITYAHAANAIAAFEASSWRATDSPFDRFISGDSKAMSKNAIKGMKLFYGEARCSSCHSGSFQTDQSFHAIAMPQIGGGKGNGFDGHDDFGRERVTADPQDRFKFRTPTLRNVVLTAPYGHDGAYNSLESVIRHHLDPINSLNNYDRSEAVLPSRPDLDAIDFIVMDDPSRVTEIADANELESVKLDDNQFNELIEFMHALTDTSSIDIRTDIPKKSISGLSIVE